MYAKLHRAMVYGIDGVIVEVEVDIHVRGTRRMKDSTRTSGARMELLNRSWRVIRAV